MAKDRGIISVIDSTTPSMTLGGITDSAINPNLQRAIMGGDSGEVDATDVAILTAQSSISWTTKALATALGSCGVAGVEATSVVAYLRKITPYGTRASGASHTSVTLGKAMMVPRTLSASYGERATLTMEAIAISTDGTTAPVTVSADTASITATPDAEEFRLGSLSLDGSAVPISSASVDFGIGLSVEGDDGDPYPTIAYIANRRPTITCMTPDRLTLADLTMLGSSHTGTTVLKFLKLEPGGTVYSTAVHVSATVNKGHYDVESVTGSQGERLGTSITITPVTDGTNAPIVVSTSASA